MRRRTCCCEEVGDREIPGTSFGAAPGFGGAVRSPPRACPCSAGPPSCAPACAGAPPGCLCRSFPERDGVPPPSFSNVCVCPTDLPRGRSPETRGSRPRPPRLTVHFVARLRAIMSITSSSFSCIELVLTTSSSLNSLVPVATVALCFILISQRCQMTHSLYKYLLECLLPYIL